jgi:hypothetical protein
MALLLFAVYWLIGSEYSPGSETANTFLPGSNWFDTSAFDVLIAGAVLVCEELHRIS